MSWEAFHFLRPWWLLALVPAAVLVWRSWRRGGGGAWSNAVDPHLLPHLVAVGGGTRAVLALLAAGWLVGILALAGPTWSRAPAVRFVAPQPPLVVVLDLSRSMTAADVGTSRLAFAQGWLARLVDRLPPRPLALVGYAATGHTLLPLTDDPRLLTTLLPQLSPDVLPLPGSVPAAGLARARTLANRAQASSGDVLLVADSADSIAATAAAEAARAGLRVSVLAVGTGAGTVEIDGKTVPVPLEDGGLRAVAAAGGGAYVDWRADPGGLAEALSAGHAALTDAERAEAANRVVWRDRGAWLALALLPLAAIGFRRGWLGLLAALWLAQPQPAAAFDWNDLWLRPEQRAQRLLDQGRGLEAADLFADPFRRGAALYRGGDYAGAAAAFERVRTADGHFNRGNALAMLGELRAARDAFEMALALDPTHRDARHNLSLVAAATRRGDERDRLKPAPFEDHRPTPEVPPSAEQPPRDRVQADGRAQDPRQSRPVEDDEPPERPSGGQAAAGLEGEGKRSSGGGGGEAAGAEERDPRGGGRSGRDRAGAAEGEPSPGGGKGGGDAERRESADSTGAETKPAAAGDAPPSPAAAAGAGGDGADEAETRTAALPPEQEPPRPEEPRRDGRTGIAGDDAADEEYGQALEQWLERIPDQPTVLLRELFRRQNERSRESVPQVAPW